MSLRDIKSIRIDSRSGYSLADLVLMLRLLGKEPMGRFSLMDGLGLGEATVKTMMKKLEDEGLAKKSPRGQMLTHEGGRIFGLLKKRISDPVQVRLPDISPKPSVALVVRGAASRIRKGIEQRDEGIRNGVDVTTLVFDGGKIRFPGASNVVEIEEINDALEENDVILVSSGKSIRDAERGGLAVGLTLI